MIIRHFFCAALVFLVAMSVFPHASRAAQSYDNCTGFIDSVPTTISTQGTWCLRKDLSTNVTDGVAITIDANNVTIDCNDFKVGGLAAGPASLSYGIFAQGRQNITVRHCNVRGFQEGIFLYAGDGHLVEDNRLDSNNFVGIDVRGAHNRVRRNAVYDTGGYPGGQYSVGIQAEADVADNIVDGVFADSGQKFATGISAFGSGTRVFRNRIGGLSGTAQGISSVNARRVIAENRITTATANGTGIFGGDGGAFGDPPPPPPYCSGNTIAGFATPMYNCADDGGNGLH